MKILEPDMGWVSAQKDEESVQAIALMQKEFQDYRDANGFDRGESKRREKEIEVLRQQLKNLVDKELRNNTGELNTLSEG
jgi:hypothetical protein